MSFHVIIKTMTTPESKTKVTDVVNKVINAVKEAATKDGRIHQVTDVIVVAMETAEKITSLSTGSQRAKAVLDALSSQEVLEVLPSNISDGIRRILEFELLGPIMTTICQAAKSRLDINNAKDAFRRLSSVFKGCCAC